MRSANGSRCRDLSITLTLVCLLSAGVVTGCSDDPEPPTGQVTISKNTRLPEQDPSFKSVTVKKDTLVFTFSKSPSEAGIKVGDIVVGQGGTTGYLRKVDTVNVSGNTLTATTSSASLEQVVEDGTWAVKLGDSQATTGSGTTSINSVTRALGTRQQALLGTQTWDLSGKTLVNQKVKGVDVKVTLSKGKATFTPDVTLAAKHSWGRLKEAKVQAAGKLSLDLEVTTSVGGSVKIDKSQTEIALIKPLTKHLVFSIGPVPVTVKLQFNLYGGYELDAAAKGTVSAGFRCTTDIKAGAEYKNKQWSNLWSPGMNCTQIPPKLGLNAKAAVRVHVRPEIKALLYHSAGPRVDVEPYLLLSGQVQSSPPAYSWALKAGLTGHLGFEMKVLSVTLVDYSATLVDWNTTVASGASKQPDAAVPDAGVPDLPPPPDTGVPKPDTGQKDGPVADVSKPDAPIPDAPTPVDAGVPDLPPPDAAVPDAAQPDQAAAQDGGTVVKGKWTPIPGGTFQMGSPSSEKCRYSDETQHQVTLTHKFSIMSTEVTQAQFNALMGYNPSYFSSCGNTCPVEKVNWHEAAAYANALSSQGGKAKCYTCTGSGKSVSCSEASAYAGKKVYQCPGYRLPTEAEWEYAYRAGTSTAFYNGGITSCSSTDPNLDKIGWYWKNSSSKTHPVGQKTPNTWGLYDMAGNVWEWCHDWYGTYPSSSVIDPVGTSGSYRVERGGSWYDRADFARAASRHVSSPGARYNFLGFRLARSVP